MARLMNEKVSVEEEWKEVGRGPVGVKWVDANKGDEEKPDYRCRLVAKEIKRGKAATPPAGGEEDVVFALGERA